MEIFTASIIAGLGTFFVFILIYFKNKLQYLRLLKQIRQHYKLENFRKIIQLCENKTFKEFWVYEALGVAFINLKDKKSGEAYFNMALELANDKKRQQVWKNYGLCLYNIQQYDAAITVFQNIDSSCLDEDFNLDNYSIPLVCGLCLYMKGDYLEAIKEFKKAPILKKRVNNELNEITYWCGVCYEALNDNVKALKLYRRVFKNNNSFEGIHEKITQLEFQSVLLSNKN